MLWPPAGQRWGVVGELDGGVRIVVTCIPTRSGLSLLVPFESTRDWLRELLAQLDLHDVPIQVGPIHTPEVFRSGPWLALAVGLSAIALFSWVINSLASLAPLAR